MSVSWSVGHHFEEQPATDPTYYETVDELGVVHCKPFQTRKGRRWHSGRMELI
jgi:hypothetical protein